jgi:hypothetical protein
MTIPPEPSVSIALRVGEVNLILAALSELPFKHVATTLASIKDQADKQLNAGPKLVEDAAP